jgi:hypothetical protein
MRGFSAVRLIPILLCAALLACSNGEAAKADQAFQQALAKRTVDVRHPVVLELYQAQGCSSCPPANANLNAVAGMPGVLALSFAVTYWDQLGWKDSFARPEFTQRQWDYAKASGRGGVSTPQVIVNGRAAIVGGDKAEFARVVAGGGPKDGPSIERDGDSVTIGAGKDSGIVWLVRFDPRVREVAIRAGENDGKTLPHRDIVTQLSALGQWTGPAARFEVKPAGDPALKTAILVQQGKGGPILAARSL